MVEGRAGPSTGTLEVGGGGGGLVGLVWYVVLARARPGDWWVCEVDESTQGDEKVVGRDGR